MEGMLVPVAVLEALKSIGTGGRGRVSSGDRQV